MPRIDPHKLLTCLSVLLAPNGGIRSADEVKRLAGLMDKFSKKLVSKCIYIQICKCTETELLDQFMAAGGWSLTHNWLSDGILSQNWPLVRELLELLLLCPVDVARLKSNSAPKLVKQLSKEGSQEGVRILAAKLVEQWLKIVKGETMAIAAMENKNGLAPVNTTGKIDCNKKNQNKTDINVKDNSVFITEDLHEDNCNEYQTTTDPLAIDSDPILQNDKHSTTDSPKSNLVFKITTSKTGKSVLQKMDQDKKSNLIDKPQLDTLETIKKTNEDVKESVKENKMQSPSQKDRDVTKTKDRERDREREKSRDKKDEKDRDRHRDRERSKSSSSSSTHRSSSSSHKSSSKSSHSSSSKSSSSSHKSSTSSKSSSSSSSRDKDKERSKSSSKSTSSSSSKEKEKEIEKDKIKEKEDKDKTELKSMQADKDKDTLAKLIPPSIDKLGKIPRKSKEETTITLSELEKKSDVIHPAPVATKKPQSISIEVRKDIENRPKTVKTLNSQFRNHGLAEEAPPPPPRKGLKKPSSLPTIGATIPSNILVATKRSSPPPKDAVVEKKLKLDITVSPQIVDKPGAIKLIAPKAKPSLLVESDMFMDALSASAPVAKKDGTKKRKRRTSDTKKDSNLDDSGTEATTPTTPTPSSSTATSISSPPPKVAALKFYQDTLDDVVELKDDKPKKDEDEVKSSDASSKTDEDEEEEDEDDIPLKRLKENEENEKVQAKSSEENIVVKIEIKKEEEELEEVVGPKPPGPGCGPDGPPGVLVIHRRRGPKKQLKWKPQESLEEIRFFELDETERVNVTKTFSDAKIMERCMEREAVQNVRSNKYAHDRMANEIEWMPLVEVDAVPPHPCGSQSKERKIQIDREQTVLKVLYFSRQMVPDSPSEPDMEYYQITDPTIIPTEDITRNPEAVNDLTNMPWPDSKGSPPHISAGLNVPFSDGPYANPPFIPMGMNMPRPVGWSMGGIHQNNQMMRMPMGPGFGGPVMIPPNMGGMGPNNGPRLSNGPGFNPNMNMMQNQNMLGMNMKDNHMNMGGPPNQNGNWFRPGGPLPNWMNKQNNHGPPRGGFNNNNGPRNWGRHNNNRYGGGGGGGGGGRRDKW